MVEVQIIKTLSRYRAREFLKCLFETLSLGLANTSINKVLGSASTRIYIQSPAVIKKKKSQVSWYVTAIPHPDQSV